MTREKKPTFRATIAAAGATCALACGLTIFADAATQKFFDDDPLWVERDHQNASGVLPSDIDLVVDLSYNLFATLGDPAANVRARNVNTVDEVADSSWFTNRLGRRALTPDEVARGPNTTAGPEPGRWTVSASKTDGVTPGFTIDDQKGQRWFLKFDPPGYRAMATGTEVAVSKLMWALGYHVAENHVAFLRREQLVVGEGARFTPPRSKPRAMRLADIDSLLKRADRERDGSYRVIASKALEGTPLGGFRFFDTRPDDPNDVVPHEHRRELRGYGVFAAWLDHVDAKAINSLDTLVSQGGRAFVRHHLIDFGSTLGSGGVAPSLYWEGFEYLVEGRQVAKQMASFGFYIPRWRTIDFYEAKSIGRMPKDNTKFDPELWKPRVPNQAFLRARADDKFWGARKLMGFTDEMLRAAITAGQFGDADAEAFLVKALAERRDAIGRTYLPGVNPIVDPALSAGTLTFRNAAVDAGFAAPPGRYRAAWFEFDNATGQNRPIAETASATTTVQTPPGLSASPGVFIRVDLSATGGPNPSWEKPVHAFFRRQGAEWRLVGFERLSDAQ